MAKVHITYRGRMFTKVKGWPRAVKESVGGSVVEWWKKYLPVHFTEQAYFRYADVFKKRYRKRTREEYLEDLRAGRKSRGRQLRAPMVWSGSLRRNVLGIQPRIGGTQQAGFRGYLRGSNVANFHTGNNPQTGNYNLVAELRVVNPDEIEDMAEVMDLGLTGFLNAAGAREVKDV